MKIPYSICSVCGHPATHAIRHFQQLEPHPQDLFSKFSPITPPLFYCDAHSMQPLTFDVNRQVMREYRNNPVDSFWEEVDPFTKNVIQTLGVLNQ